MQQTLMQQLSTSEPSSLVLSRHGCATSSSQLQKAALETTTRMKHEDPALESPADRTAFVSQLSDPSIGRGEWSIAYSQPSNNSIAVYLLLPLHSLLG